MSQHRREMSQLLLTTKLIEKCMHDRTLLTIYNYTRVLSDLFDLALTFPHKSSAGLFNALFTRLMYEKVAQWLKILAVNHDIMGSSPAETVFFYFFVFTYSY